MIITAEWAAIILSALIAITGVFLWAMRSIIAPLKILIKDNTETLSEIRDDIKEHRDSLTGLGLRLTAVETTHRLRGCDEMVMGK